MDNESHQIHPRNSQKLCNTFIVHYGGKFRLPKKAENAFKMGYDSELDTSSE